MKTSNKPFKFKQFTICQEKAIMKVNTDSIILGAYLDPSSVSSVLDIGTGTGILSLMMAQGMREGGVVDAVEIDEASAAEAKGNFDDQCFDKVKISIFSQSIQDYSAKHPDKKYELILTNPPFFSGGTLSHHEDRNTVRQTIKLSHTDLLRIASKHLATKGRFALILPYIEGLRLIELAEMYQLYLHQQLSVRSKPASNIERLVLVFSKEKQTEVKEDNLVIYAKEGKYSEAYIELTKEYYATDLSV